MKAILTFLSGYKSYLLIAAGIILVAIAADWHGHQQEKVIQANAKATATLKGVNAHDKVNRAVSKMPDSDLDSELAQWMRD